ncbi:lactonase family protein [Staphylococcus simiae]|uniref:6-phosphogluconolactonase n=1 Tax=Staphylococcus simiae TaxID=308354 RepID=UPI001A95BFC4|nr:lactonase family protein [Staphylococcus simiae]MBO1198359.1 lactonase family protein [Staphylococcus simiae]MBO1200349.1 lactonase family protein [Staphylococcus simiae]MBO1202622.1 lactonase family protein [Staphylococcus simiae]MBO1210351.1 lactonase family protein [Staphylococcus simiae]MBO1228804.1 lactonase family protein [Staphylococcus simiae]
MTMGYIGSYTKKGGKGIYHFDLNEQEGRINFVETGYELEASTYLAHNDKFLYGITKEGEQCGVASFKIEADGQLTLINKCLPSTTGTGCYVAISQDNQYLFEAVYGAGIIRLYKLNVTTGEVEQLIEELAHDFPTGSHERQDHPHAHYLNQTPDGKYVVATDLGTDRIVAYQFGEDGFKEYAQSKFKDADGTRHIEFHDNGKYAYVVHELSNEVSVTAYHDGHFEELARYQTIPQDFTDATKLAAVRLSRDQQFLYVSNRGHNSIAIYKVLADGSKLELVAITHTGDDFPRDFNITPSNKYLVCAHEQGQSKVTVFERNEQTGELTLTDDHSQALEGVCVIF